MNWDAIGAIGEIIGAFAVMLTLLVLMVQVRSGTRALKESNALERAAAIDRHSDTVARWRAKMTESRELTELWLKGFRDAPMDEVELSRLNFLWIELINTQRANYTRALSVGEDGLARQAVFVVATSTVSSRTMGLLWEAVRAWTMLASKEFTVEIEAEIERMRVEGVGDFNPLPLLDRLQPDGIIK